METYNITHTRVNAIISMSTYAKENDLTYHTFYNKELENKNE